jgi:hypothetical protein
LADRITTDADIVASGYITTNQMARLTPHEWAEEGGTAGPWTRWHDEAWAEILRQLYSRPDPLEESDLSDSSELQPAAIQYVLYLAYAANNEMDRAKHHLAQFNQRMTSIRPTTLGSLDGTTEARGWGRAVPYYRV